MSLWLPSWYCVGPPFATFCVFCPYSLRPIMNSSSSLGQTRQVILYFKRPSMSPWLCLWFTADHFSWTSFNRPWLTPIRAAVVKMFWPCHPNLALIKHWEILTLNSYTQLEEQWNFCSGLSGSSFTAEVVSSSLTDLCTWADVLSTGLQEQRYFPAVRPAWQEEWSTFPAVRLACLLQQG